MIFIVLVTKSNLETISFLILIEVIASAAKTLELRFQIVKNIGVTFYHLFLSPGWLYLKKLLLYRCNSIVELSKSAVFSEVEWFSSFQELKKACERTYNH